MASGDEWGCIAGIGLRGRRRVLFIVAGVSLPILMIYEDNSTRELQSS
jgi:hypothetical protein